MYYSMKKASFSWVFFCSMVYVMLISVNAQVNKFNVMDYGAAGDGNTDDSLAFIRSWNATCMAVGSPTMIIPKGKTFLLQPINFFGPCKSNEINILLSGLIVAPNNPKDWKVKDDTSRWIAFKGVSGLRISGLGVIDGRGKDWWDLSCKLNPEQGCLDDKPTSVVFENCEQLKMKDMYFKDSPQVHVKVYKSNNVDLGSLRINASADSPNTDGIDISSSHDVSVHDSIIGTGDDCIAIEDHSSDVEITNVYCGPGHGISIGSLGGEGEVNVSKITVDGATFYRSTNGVRIKTWEVGRGIVQHVQFSNLNFTDVKNPIIIDQYYGKQDISELSGVRIYNVSYKGARGTSATQVAINLNCNSKVPCTEITLQDIQLKSAVPGINITSACSYAHGSTKGIVSPQSCLLP